MSVRDARYRFAGGTVFALSALFLAAALTLAGGAEAGQRGGGPRGPGQGPRPYHRWSGGVGWWGPGWWGPGWGSYWGWGSTFVVQSAPGFVRGRFGVVKTDVTPEEAELYLDGTFIGRSDDFDGYPDYLYLKPGSYSFEFRCPNYEPLQIGVDVVRGRVVRVDRKMKLLPGKSALDDFPNTREGMPLGRVFGPKATPVRPDTEPVQDGRASVEVEPPAPESRSVDEMPARPASLRAKLAWKVEPADAAVYLDDEYLGSGDELAALPRGTVAAAGVRSVTILRPGYRTRSLEVEAKAGEVVTVEVRLERTR